MSTCISLSAWTQAQIEVTVYPGGWLAGGFPGPVPQASDVKSL